MTDLDDILYLGHLEGQSLFRRGPAQIVTGTVIDWRKTMIVIGQSIPDLYIVTVLDFYFADIVNILI